MLSYDSEQISYKKQVSSLLDPFQELDDKTKEFCEIVKIEIAKDGGIERLIKKFKN